MIITGWYSIGLDVLRFVAAIGVALGHLTVVDPSMGCFAAIDGRVFVMCFFVLSGYFIAYTTERNKRDGSDYAVARLSRVYSVLLPALILTEILGRLGYLLNSDYYGHWLQGDGMRNILSLFNIQCLWALDLNPMSNHPLWSLSYECWYYLIFGLACFLPRDKTRWLAVGLVCLIAGPRIMQLMPVWLLGVICYHLHGRLRPMSVWVAWCGAIAPLFLLLAMAFSRFHLGVTKDLFGGILSFLSIFCLRYALPEGNPPGWFARMAREGANFSFSIYVTHYPILLFGGILPVIFNHNLLLMVYYHPVIYAWFVFVGSILFAWVFSLITERRRKYLADKIKPWVERAFKCAPHLPLP